MNEPDIGCGVSTASSTLLAMVYLDCLQLKRLTTQLAHMPITLDKKIDHHLPVITVIDPALLCTMVVITR